MRRLGDLFTQMGFKPEASNSVKTAFLKHLKKAATATSMENRKEIPKQSPSDRQLSFDADVLEAGNFTAKKSA